MCSSSGRFLPTITTIKSLPEATINCPAANAALSPTPDTALGLSYYFGNSPKFWLGLQDDFDLEEEQINKQQELEKIKRFDKAA